MRKVFLILFLIPFNTFAQNDSLVWTTNNELGVISFAVQQSLDTANWNTLAQVSPRRKDTNIYSFSLPVNNSYYRVVANMLGGIKYRTKPDLLTSVLPVELSNISVFGKILRFTSNNENNLKSYIIYESIDGINWEQTVIVQPKGNSDYKVQLK